MAYTIAHSPLVKTAFLPATRTGDGFSRLLDAHRLRVLTPARCRSISSNVCVVRNGGVAADYTETAGRDVMRRSEIHVRVDLGAGSAGATVWTSDLSHDYVRINAEYRT